MEDGSLLRRDILHDFGIRNSSVSLLRLDCFGPFFSGNKTWKLKYNIAAMKEAGLDHMLSFGGPHSNHIAALAEAGKYYDFRTSSIICGSKGEAENNTLKKGAADGMQVFFVNRPEYNLLKGGLVDASDICGMKDFYFLPEGGSNMLGVKGCAEILKDQADYDIVACPVGTGATIAGVIASAPEGVRVIGFPAVKDESLSETIVDLLDTFLNTIPNQMIKCNWELTVDYHFGGFARAGQELIDFYQDFLKTYKIELDFVYTAKMMYGLKEMMMAEKIPASARILAIHSGGLQGNASMLEKYGKALNPRNY